MDRSGICEPAFRDLALRTKAEIAINRGNQITSME